MKKTAMEQRIRELEADNLVLRASVSELRGAVVRAHTIPHTNTAKDQLARARKRRCYIRPDGTNMLWILFDIPHPRRLGHVCGECRALPECMHTPAHDARMAAEECP